MSQILNPYLSFRGQAAEAIEFYRSVFGGEANVGTFGGFGMPTAEEEKDWVMHAQLTTSAGFTIMASDVPTSMEWDTSGSKIAVSLSGDDAEALTGYYNALAEGGEVRVPLAAAPWGDSYGELVDRFGIRWLVNISAVPTGE